MRNTCLNGLEGTSLLNKEQSCQSSRLHCVVMAIDDFHNFKMMTRNKALKSKEISPNGENTATRSYKQTHDPSPVRPHLECVSDFYLPVSVNSILQDQGQNSSSPINFL